MAGIASHIPKALSYLIKGLLIALLFFGGVPLIDTALHTGLHFCPHTFFTFEQSEIIPVVYGLPTEEMYQEAKEGKIALGWCVLGPVSGLLSSLQMDS